MLILLANEPRSYRETLGAALRMRRPGDEVVLVEPDEMDAFVTRFAPQAVISSRQTPALSSRAGWLLLYPRFDDEAVVDVSGQQMILPAPDLQLVLAFLTLVGASA